LRVAQIEHPRCVRKIDVLRGAPALLEFGQLALGKVIEDATAAIVDDDDHQVLLACQREPAEIVLAGQVADQRDGLAVGSGDPGGGRDVAVDPLAPRLAKKWSIFSSWPDKLSSWRMASELPMNRALPSATLSSTIWMALGWRWAAAPLPWP
jgi:hypothetical protein